VVRGAGAAWGVSYIVGRTARSLLPVDLPAAGARVGDPPRMTVDPPTIRSRRPGGKRRTTLVAGKPRR